MYVDSKLIKCVGGCSLDHEYMGFKISISSRNWAGFANAPDFLNDSNIVILSFEFSVVAQ